MLKHSLRTLVATAVCSLPVVLGTASEALADQRDFTVYNQTNQDIYYLYVSDSNSNYWGDDVLGSSVLPSGNSLFIYFDDYSNSCLYDIRAIAANGAELDARQVNLCQISEYYIR
ncbi:hypothetical protein [Egbenema bharatensis]|uniref:hypothetical protein n=1 Tax=Egbenema bharatensis TaxID=3463334 RepID=UPI003A86F250